MGSSGLGATVSRRSTPQGTVDSTCGALFWVHPETSGRTTLLTGDRIVLGSDPACDVVLASDQVSRQHLELRRSGLIMHARDLGSTYRLMDAATDEELSDVRKPDGRA